MQIRVWWAATQKVAYRCRNRGIVLAWQVGYSNRPASRKFRAHPGRILSEKFVSLRELDAPTGLNLQFSCQPFQLIASVHMAARFAEHSPQSVRI